MKNNNSSASTMRRKQIEDTAPERKAQASANEQSSSLNQISTGLSELQASTDLISDTIEGKANQILDGLADNKKAIDDASAASELAAEASEKTTEEAKKLNSFASKISGKLSKLSNMFEQKLGAANGDSIHGPVLPAENSTLAAIKAAMPIEVEQPSLKELLEKIVPTPEPNDPNDNGIGGEAGGNREDKPSKETAGSGIDLKLDDLIKATKAGFKASLSVSDRISNMLFKYTISAAAEAAKLAGMMFALILGIDLIKIHFKYWSDLFNKSFDKFFAKAEEWGPLIASVLDMAEGVKKMWDEKNWIGLGKVILLGLGNIAVNIADLLFLGIAKITAALLRAFGKDDWAEKVEGGALEKFQENGAVLDKDDQDTLAKYQDKRDQKDYEMRKDLAKTWNKDNKGREMALQYGVISKETAAKIDDGTFASNPEMELPEDQRLKIRKTQNETKAALIRTRQIADNTESSDENKLKNLNESMASIKKNIDDPVLNSAPKTRQELQDDLNKLTIQIEKIKTPTKVSPAPVEEQEDVQKSARIVEQQKAEKAAAKPDATTANVVNNTVLNKSNKTSYNMPPTSSTPAPGMGGATRVN